MRQVEEMLLAARLKVLPVAIADGGLIIGLVAPEQRTRGCRSIAELLQKQVHAVGLLRRQR
jgi:hypothetical protein